MNLDNAITIMLQACDLDFLMRNAAVSSEGDYRKYALPLIIHKNGTEPLIIQMHRDPVANANEYIKATVQSKSGISDGYHTFHELYEHRVINFISVCRLLGRIPDEAGRVWISKKHSDGTEWAGWFIMGIDSEPGKQITYHLPIRKWDECHQIARSRERAPEWDGHTPADVLDRLAKL